MWEGPLAAMQRRAEQIAKSVEHGFPHWADSATGEWTTTVDGDWTGGALPGMLWLVYRGTGSEDVARLARAWCSRLRPRARLRTAFKGFGFYYGAALGQILAGDKSAEDVALEAAASLRDQFDSDLGLIPLGAAAEESADVGDRVSSIDSLQASPLLFWAARRTADRSYSNVAARHTRRVLEIHCRDDGGIVQSSTLAKNGAVIRHFTHKGASDASVWARAEAWGMLYAAMAYSDVPEEKAWLRYGTKAADWWLAHVDDGMVAYWDFDDPAIPHTDRDTAATAIVCAALLKLARLVPSPADRTRYRAAAERTARALVSGYLTPVDSRDTRTPGRLVGGCFTNRPGARPADAARDAELIFGSYYLLEALSVLGGVLDASEI